MGESNGGRERRVCDWGLRNWGPLRSLLKWMGGKSRVTSRLLV